MMRKYGLALLAALGVIAIVVAILVDNRPARLATPVPSALAPFSVFVAGAAIVEPLNGSVAVGAPVAGIVTAIDVRPGDKVTSGATLFRIDDGDLQAQRPVMLAAVKEAKERLMQATELYRLALNIPDRRALSEEEIITRRSAVKVANAGLASAQARVKQMELDAGRRTVRARVSGEVLQVNIRPGEFAQSAAAKPLILMAAGDRLVLRVDIDEFEASRIKPGARAIAYPRGRPTLQLPLTFERIEPSIVAKTSLTGSSTERIDSRVLQVIYSFSSAGFSVFVGQQMDVYIEVRGAEAMR